MVYHRISSYHIYPSQAHIFFKLDQSPGVNLFFASLLILDAGEREKVILSDYRITGAEFEEAILYETAA